MLLLISGVFILQDFTFVLTTLGEQSLLIQALYQ